MNSISEIQKRLSKSFAKIYGNTDGARLFHAPGRVNIIGEHIDYNGGHVLPCALDVGTYALVRPTNGGIIRFASLDFDGTAEIALDGGNIVFDAARGWVNYPLGVVHQMSQDPQGSRLAGFDVLFSGNIPRGAGLSSSASIEVVMATALNTLFGLDYEMIELAQLAQRAENQFCGVNCGIMDQFAVAMAEKNKAIYLNCDTLEYRHVPLELGDYGIVIMDTNKRRRLNESKYNERRAECEAALADLQTTPAHNITHLAHLTPDAFGGGRRISKEVNRKRARHVVSENHRVGLAIAALEARDLATLGDLLYRSHASLRDDYEVSCAELDAIVEAAMAHPACIGARMTGAGFGGCAIALVRLDAAADFMQQVAAQYEREIGYAPTMHLQASGRGAREIIEYFALYHGQNMIK